jgi:hypothetical protein
MKCGCCTHVLCTDGSQNKYLNISVCVTVVFETFSHVPHTVSRGRDMSSIKVTLAVDCRYTQTAQIWQLDHVMSVSGKYYFLTGWLREGFHCVWCSAELPDILDECTKYT